MGEGNLTVSSIIIQAVSSDFSITSAPALPVVVEPGEAVDVEVTFTPSAEEYSWVVMEVGSNDPDESYIEVELDATGILPLSEQIADIRAFFDESVEQGTLVGCGRLPRLAKLRLEIMRLMLKLAGKLIDRGLDRLACIQLRCIYECCDGQSRPVDLVEGEAVAELAAMVQDLIKSLECKCMY